MGDCAGVCAMKFWRELVTAPNPIPIPITTLVPGSAMDLGIKVQGVPWNTTSQMKF